jgi:hypothetical protein
MFYDGVFDNMEGMVYVAEGTITCTTHQDSVD